MLIPDQVEDKLSKQNQNLESHFVAISRTISFIIDWITPANLEFICVNR